MKYLLLVIALGIGTATIAQFNFYTQAGGNYTSIRITRTTGIENENGGFGWQAGFGTEYHTQFGYFVYLGAGLRHESYERDSLSSFFPDTVSEYKYRPLFINFPFGIGYQFPLKNQLSLKVYGGLNTQVGLAGKVTKNNLFYGFDSVTNSSFLIRKESNTHSLKYGRASRRRYAYDLANANWGVNFGVGLNYMNSAEVNVFYHHGFNNFLPNRDAAEEINKLGFVELNVKIYFPNPYYEKRQKRTGH
jgi:hypothetical protein